MSKKIEVGSLVRVNFNASQLTLCSRAIVKHQPQATGDSWIFEDDINGQIHYVSEGCTVTLIANQPPPPTEQ